MSCNAMEYNDESNVNIMRSVYGRSPCVPMGLILFVESFIVVVCTVFIAFVVCVVWVIGDEVNKLQSFIHYIFFRYRTWIQNIGYGYKILEYFYFRICTVA